MTRFFSMPIRAQLFLMAFIVALPSVGIIIYSGLEQRNSSINEARTDTRKLADNIASEQKILVAGVQQLMGALAQLPEVRSHDTGKLQPVLSDVLKINPQLLNIFIADKAGTMWISAKPSKAAISVADRRHFINALATGRFSSGEYIVGRMLGKPTLGFGYPYKNLKGEFAGVIAINIDLDYSREILLRSKLPQGSSYFILDHKGVVLSRGLDPAHYVGKQSNQERFQRFQDGPEGDSFVGKGIDGVERFITYRKLYLAGEKTPYVYIATSIPVGAVVSKANRSLLFKMALLAPFMLFAFYLAWFIGRRSIVDRISILQSASHLLAKGHLHTRVSDLVEGGELGELGRSFDDMACALARDLAERKRVEQALHEQAQLLEQEVAERQVAQEELAIKHQQLERLNNSLEGLVADTVDNIRQKDRLLIQQSRQAAMGEMINNIAHQWRQPLNNVGLIVQNLVFSFEIGELTIEEMKAECAVAMETIQFMSRTIDDFRNFFRQDKDKKNFPVIETVNKTLVFVSPTLKNSCINVELDVCEQVAAVGYPNEFSQVLLIIFNNAKDVLTERRVVDPCIRIRVFSDNGRAVTTISDNGGGIADDVLPMIFDPYFSTKQPGKGTGIGLFMSKAIIEQNMNGSLTARNSGGGAEFRIEI